MMKFRKKTLKRNKVLWKSFILNWKNYVVFFFSSMIMVSVLFNFLAVKNMLDSFDTAVLVLGATHGISKMVMNGTVILGVLSVFLMVFSLKYYVETRRKCYGVYKLLGINGKLLKRMIMLEYAGTIVCAYIGGFFFGNVLYQICKKIIEKQAFTNEPLADPHLITYVMTVVIGLIILVFALAINREIAIETDMIQITTGGASEERMPKKRLWIGISVGIVLMAFGIYQFSVKENGENILLVMIFLAGVLLLVRYGGSAILRNRKMNKKYYYGHLLSNQSFYYQFRMHSSYIMMLFLLQFIILFYYPTQVLTNVPVDVSEDYYPYDFVWKMNRYDEKDVEFLERLKEEYHAKTIEIPAVCITVAAREPATDMKKGYYQGQNIGISESSYKMLTGNELELEEDEIAVFLQQGKERPIHSIDFYSIGRNEEFIHFGPAYWGHFDRIHDKFTDSFKVKDTIAENVFGEYANDLNEHVIVFADKVFDDVDKIDTMEKLLEFKLQRPPMAFTIYDEYTRRYTDPEGYLNRLVLIRADEQYHNEITEALKEGYDWDSYNETIFDQDVRKFYVTKVTKERLLAERIYRNVIGVILFAVFVFAEIFIIALRMLSESSRLQEYNRFCQIFGMPEKRRNKAVYSTTRIFIIVPTVISMVTAMLFTLITLHMRDFSRTEIISYMRMYLPIVGGFMVIQFVVYSIVKLMAKRRMVVKL